MKNILFITSIFLSSFTFCQLSMLDNNYEQTIGEITYFSKKNIELIKYPETNEYIFYYLDDSFNTTNENTSDTNFKKIDVRKNFSFVNEDSAIDNLYNTIIEGFNTVPRDPIALRISNNLIFLEFYKFLFSTYVRFKQVNIETKEYGLSVWFNKKQANKLFGR